MDFIPAEQPETQRAIFASGCFWGTEYHLQKAPGVISTTVGYTGGRTVDGLCQQMDIGPTLLELANVEVPETMEAQSLSAPLAGKSWEPREFVYAEHGRDGILQGTDFVTMVRDARWKLVHFVDEDEGQLFDLETDPNEQVDLWDDPAAADQKQRLITELTEWRVRSLVHTADWSADFR